MTLKVGLVGYGLAGAAFHAPFIAASPDLELAALVTRDPERRAAAQAAHPGAALLDDAAALHDGRPLDLVVVATPNRSHVPLATAAIDAGVAVVVDKPLAPAAAQARELAERAAARGVLLTVFQNRRWDGDLLTLRALLEHGELGRVHRFESRFERWRPEVAADAWREAAEPEAGGGLLLDLGAHLVDQAVLLFGPVTHVYAELGRARPGAAVDDDTFVALTHAGGTRSHLWMSAAAADVGPRLRVLGDRAAYVKHGLDVQEARLRAGTDPRDPGFGAEPREAWGRLIAGEQALPVPTQDGDYAAFYRGLAAALLHGGPPPVEPGEAVAVLELLEAARTSAAEGRVVQT
jgi:predicted dehydrogenase